MKKENDDLCRSFFYGRFECEKNVDVSLWIISDGDTLIHERA